VLKILVIKEISKALLDTHMIVINVEKGIPQSFQNQDEYIVEARLDVVAPVKN